MCFTMNQAIIIFTEYQTFIVGLLGFAGVIYTIKMNSILAKEQYEMGIDNERQALKITLLAELESIKQSYEDRIKIMSKSNHDGPVLIPECVMDTAYQKLLPRLSLLNLIQIRSVLDAYQLARELPIRLRLCANSQVNDFKGYIPLNNEDIPTAIKLHQSFLGKVELALARLR